MCERVGIYGLVIITYLLLPLWMPVVLLWEAVEKYQAVERWAQMIRTGQAEAADLWTRVERDGPASIWTIRLVELLTGIRYVNWRDRTGGAWKE